MQGSSRGILHTHATNINQSCNPIFLTTKIREMNRSTTNVLAIVKKVIETPSVAGCRPPILDRLPLGQSYSPVAKLPARLQSLVYGGWGWAKMARARRPHRLDRSSNSYMRSEVKIRRKGRGRRGGEERKESQKGAAENCWKWRLKEEVKVEGRKIS